MITLEKKERLHYIDGLRAIACLMILFHHTITGTVTKWLINHHALIPAIYLSNFTQSGVEVFFLLSGILLLMPYFNGEKIFNVSLYYRRRFQRLYSPYFIAVIFAGFVIWINTYMPTWYSSILIKFSVPGFLKQFLIFNLKGDYYNLAWWSLQIEVIFYLLVPVILIIFRRAKLSYSLIITFFLTVLLQWVAVHFLPKYYSVSTIILSPVRFVDYLFCFVLGVFLAKKYFTEKEAYVSVAAGIGILISGYWYSPFMHMGFAFLYFGLIILIFHRQKIKAVLSTNIFVWIGERSYSLFLVHFSVLYLNNYIISWFLPDRTLMYGVLSRVFGILFSFGISMLLFHFVERRQARGLQTADQFWPPLFNKKK